MLALGRVARAGIVERGRERASSAEEVERLERPDADRRDARRVALGRQPAEGALRAFAARGAGRAAGRRADPRRRRRRAHRALPAAARDRRRRARRSSFSRPTSSSCRVSATGCSSSRAARSCATLEGDAITEENITGAAITSGSTPRQRSPRARCARCACAGSPPATTCRRVVLAVLILGLGAYTTASKQPLLQPVQLPDHAAAGERARADRARAADRAADRRRSISRSGRSPASSSWCSRSSPARARAAACWCSGLLAVLGVAARGRAHERDAGPRLPPRSRARDALDLHRDPGHLAAPSLAARRVHPPWHHEHDEDELGLGAGRVHRRVRRHGRSPSSCCGSRAAA